MFSFIYKQGVPKTWELEDDRRLLTDIYERIKGHSIQPNMWKISLMLLEFYCTLFNRGLVDLSDKARVYEVKKSACLMFSGTPCRWWKSDHFFYQKSHLWLWNRARSCRLSPQINLRNIFDKISSIVLGRHRNFPLFIFCTNKLFLWSNWRIKFYVHPWTFLFHIKPTNWNLLISRAMGESLAWV